MKMKIILIGEAFRMGGQGNRQRDLENSIEGQKSACESHNKLAESLESLGVEVKFLVESYCSKHEDKMRSWYGERIESFCTRENLVGLNNLASSALEKIEEADCILICRIDILLKDFFIKIFDPKCKKLMFPFICFIVRNSHIYPWEPESSNKSKQRSNSPRVSDMFMFVPKEFIDKLKEKISISHSSWFDYLNTFDSTKMCFMIDTYHDSDSAKDYNPLYKIVNRNASNFWHSIGYKVGSDMLPLQTEEIQEFDDWKLTDHLKDEQKLLFPMNTWEWWHKEGEGLFTFISLMNFNKSEIFGQTIDFHHSDESYWKIDEETMTIFNSNKKVFSIMNKISEGVYCGKSPFYKNFTFMIKKCKNDDKRPYKL